MSRARRCIFVDRDGVLNRPILADGRSYAPRSLADFVLMPNVGKAIKRVKKAGFLAIAVTNQKDVARGLVTAETLSEMHAKMLAEVPLDDVRICICADDCPCYKPRPGMILDASLDWNIDLSRSFIIGDTWRDVGAGRAAGMTTVMIDWGYEDQFKIAPDYVVGDLAEGVDLILRQLMDD